MRKTSKYAAPAVLIALCGAPAAQAADSATPGETPQPGVIRLSNEKSETRVATPEALVRTRSQPDPNATAGPRLRATTEHGAPEVYLALTEADGTDGQRWVRIRIPRRPNGQTGWVPRDALGRYRVLNTSLEVNRSTLRVTLFRNGRQVMQFPVGVGAKSTPTPGGHFWIREKLRYKRDPMYGDRALGTSAYAPQLENWPLGGVIGMHGTSYPELIPGRPSHGCIRIRNGDLARLFKAVPVGTPLRIR